MPRRKRNCRVCRAVFIAGSLEVTHCSSCCTTEATTTQPGQYSARRSPPHEQLLERDDEKQTTTTLSSYSLDIHNDGTILSQAEEPIMDEKTKVQQATGLKSEQEDNFDEEEEGDNASEAADDLNCTQIVLLSSDSEEDDDDDDDQPLAKLVESANNTHRATSNVPDTDAAKVQAFVDNEKEDDDVVVVINDDDDDDQEDNTFDDPLVMDLASSNDKNNNELLSCNICGISLAHIQSGWNGRLNHIKRCAKKHHYTAKDTRFNDDYELFAPPMTKSAAATATTSNNQTVNPYTKPSDWHGRDDDAKLAQAQLSKQAAPSAFSTLMAGARRAAKLQKIQAQSPQAKRGRDWKQGGGGRGYQNRQDGSERPCPFYKKIPNTDFVVDGFHYAKASLTSNYFLSHFHSDHYGGITKAWDAGIIYCSIGTANLVHQQLGVDRKFLHPLPMNTPTLIASQNNKPIEVTLLDANHCPGAVMFLFMVGKRKILHVGDFRWNRQVMLTLAPLTPFFCGDDRIDDLFLDTTYCDAKYDLPSQQETIEAAIKVAVEEMEKAQSNKKKLLMLFGAYTIGKERIYLSVAAKLGKKVYVDSRRMRILKSLEWTNDELSHFTTKPDETCIWVVPLGHINMKKLDDYLITKTSRFDRVVGFRPTGWSLSKKGSGIVTTTDRGRTAVHNVPYSEHSSFPELVDCLECLRPKRIIPTVSVSKSQDQVDLLLSKWKR